MRSVRGYLLRAAWGGLALGATVACKNVDDPPVPAAIAGTWVYTETLAENVFDITCSDTGTYTFTQDGPKVGGMYVQTGKCRSADAVAFNNGHGPITNGTVTNVRVQFTADSLCSYTGLLSTTHDAVNAGTGICDFVDPASSNHYSFQISWKMQKQ